jgi:hypothetical protein
MINLAKHKWFRSLWPSKTFVNVDGEWMDIRRYHKGKVIDVDGKWHTMVFCDCGNELVHSKSFVNRHQTKLPDRQIIQTLYEYKCSNCGRELFFRPDIIPGLLRCNPNGDPIGPH